MKACKLLLVLIILISFFSCGTTSAPLVDTDDINKGPQKKIVNETIDLAVKINKKFGDGMLDTYVVLTYNEGTSDPVLEEKYDSTGVILEKAEYKYSDDMLLKKIAYGRSGAAESSHIYKYDNGLLIEDLLSDASGKMQSKSVYKYDNDNKKIKWDIIGSDGAVLGSNEYLYEGGLVSRINTLTPDGKLEKYVLDMYNEKGNIIKEEFYNADGVLDKITEYEYADDKLKAVFFRKANGAVIRKEEYEYADNIKTVKYLDNKNRLLEIEEYELEKRDVKTVIWE